MLLNSSPSPRPHSTGSAARCAQLSQEFFSESMLSTRSLPAEADQDMARQMISEVCPADAERENAETLIAQSSEQKGQAASRPPDEMLSRDGVDCEEPIRRVH